MRKLTEEQKEFVQLYAVEHKKMVDIAQIIHKSTSQLYVWLRKPEIVAEIDKLNNAEMKAELQASRKKFSIYYSNKMDEIIKTYDKLLKSNKTSDSVKARLLNDILTRLDTMTKQTDTDTVNSDDNKPEMIEFKPSLVEVDKRENVG